MGKEKIAELAGVRSLKGWASQIIIGFTAISIILSVVHTFNIRFFDQVLPIKAYLAALYGLILSLVFLLYPAHKGASLEKVPWYDFLFFVGSLIPSAFVVLYCNRIIEEPWEVAPTKTILILGLFLSVATLEAVRRTGGWVLFFLVGIVSVYPLFAQYMPGFLVAKSYSLSRLIGFYYAGSESIFGIPMDVFGKIVLGFLIFSVGLQLFGGADFFLKLSFALVGFVRGGPAKVAVVSSGFMASMSGSAAANVIATGSVTIPVMKKVGYAPNYAGAVEAVASTGGVLTPPVMGATAFLIAEFLNETYATVCLAAAIPALLYYLTILIQTDFYAVKTGLKGLPRRECPALFPTLKEGWFYLFVIILLIVLIIGFKMETKAPFYTLLFMMIVGSFKKETRATPERVVEFCKRSGVTFAQLIGLFGGVGMIIGAFTLTGFAHSLSSAILSLAGGKLPLILLMCALASFILGMGLSITACYIILAMLVAPALVNAGIHPMAAHLFVMYWGMVSYITPPVALAAYIAAGIAQGDPMRVGFIAVRLGVGLLFLPFIFVTRPALIGHGPFYMVLATVILTMWTLTLFSGAVEGYLPLVNRLNFPVRILLLVLVALYLIPNLHINLITSGIGAIIIIFCFFQQRMQLRQNKTLITTNRN